MVDYRLDPLWLKLNFLSGERTGDLHALVVSKTGCSSALATVLIDEYRRFLFLALRVGHEVAPPPSVDRVWQLHVQHAANYWNVLGELISERAVSEASGAIQEADVYRKTLASYEGVFGSPAPPQIWPHKLNDGGGLRRAAARMLRRLK